MHKIMIGAVAMAMTAGAALADPVVGTWKTEAGDTGNYAHVEVSTCGVQICGVITEAYDTAGNPVETPNIGKRMIWDMNADGEGQYSGGKIWAPDRDKTYNSKMTLSGNNLSVSGCVLGVCRSQTWSRVN